MFLFLVSALNAVGKNFATTIIAIATDHITSIPEWFPPNQNKKGKTSNPIPIDKATFRVNKKGTITVAIIMPSSGV